MIRLFLDANVLFTATHNPGGKAAFVIEMGVAGHWKLLTSPFAVAETKRNLANKYPATLQNLERLLDGIELVNQPSDGYCPEQLPEKDRPIFLAAAAGNATHLITGDLRHFGPIMGQPEITSGILIQTVAQFLAEV